MAASVESSNVEFGAAGKIDTQAMPVDEEDDFRRAEESSEDATDNEKSAVSSADESGTKSETEEDNEQKKENAATKTKVVIRKEKPKGNGDFIFPLDTNAAEVVKSDGLRRERKQVERFAHIPVKHEEKPIIISEGSGVKLGDIEYIAHQINKHKPADLANLHRLFYDRRGTATQIKKNIRLFSGFPFEDKSAEFIKKKKQMVKWNPKVVREICDVLGLQKKASKDQTIEGVLEFCLQPSDKGKKIGSRKSSSSQKSKRSPSKSKKSTDSSKSESGTGKKEKSTKRKLASSGSGSEQDEVAGKSTGSGKSKAKEPPNKKSREGPARKASAGKIYAEDVDEELERMVSDSESDFKSEEDKPKKKAKKVVKPKPSIKKSSTKKTPKSSRPPDSDSGSEEPKSTKEPVKIPTDEDLKKSVQKIIKNSDLKKVSMRMVLDQVSGEYPGVDLQDKKALIKSLVQEMLP